jgi:hypothetical protein
MQVPAGFEPQLYFSELAWRVEIMWQPENSRIEKSDFNMLAVRPAKDSVDEFVLRLPAEGQKFFVAIHHPGWLRYVKAGPFTATDFVGDRLSWDVPKPASIEMKLDSGAADVASLPFRGVQYHLMRQREPGSNSYLSVSNEQRSLADTSFRVADLGPGNYLLQLTTQPTNSDPLKAPAEGDPGRFFDRKSITLNDGQAVNEIFHYKPFDAQAFRGNRTARVKVIGANGLPVTGRTLKVTYSDGHYGSLTAFNGAIPPNGVVVLEGITDSARDDIPFGPYAAELDSENLGFFRVLAKEGPQEFTFRIVPKAGDMAPDIEVFDIETQKPLRLRELRGKLLYLEFWETGCGPCQPEMAKLNELQIVHGERWKGDVVLLPIGFDSDPKTLFAHVNRNGWTKLRHYWSKRSGDEYFADASLTYVVHGVPTALLIDRDGKISWRGHPASIDLASKIEELLSRDANK